MATPIGASRSNRPGQKRHARPRGASGALLLWTVLTAGGGGLTFAPWMAARAEAGDTPAGASPRITPPRLVEAPPVVRPDADSGGEPEVPVSPLGAPDPNVARPEVAVELALTIDADGRVGDARVSRSGGVAFDDAALAAARAFRFEPARRDGVATPARVTFRYLFPAVAAASVPGADGRGTDVRTPEPAGTAASADAPAAGSVEAGAAAPVSPGSAAEPLEYGATATVREAARGVTRRTVEGRELTDTPGTRGDPLRVIELLPGVARPPLANGAIIIRGSAPSDSEISFEGAPVLRLYHFGGLTSFVNGRLIDHIDLYPGNFSTRYGRKLGGMVDVGARDPRTDRWHALGDVNLIDGTVLAEGPVGPRLSLALSARRSYVGDVLKAVSPADAGITAAPVYDDYQLFATWRPTERDRVRFLGYGSRDSLGLIFKASDQDPALQGAAAARTYFHRAQLSWERRYSDRLRHNAQVTVGHLGFLANIGGALSQDIRGPEVFGRGELEWRAADRLTLATGLDVTAQWLTAHYRGPIIGASEGDPSQSGALTNQQFTTLDASALFFRPAGYVEGTWRGATGTTVIAGARADYFSDIQRWSFDPRLTARQQVGLATTLKGGVGLFSQAPDLGQAVPGFGNPNLLPARALHLAFGVERALGESISVGAELFGKRMWHLVVGGDGPGMLNNDGVGRAYGAEALIKARLGERATAFLTYTLSRSERRDHPNAPSPTPWRLFDYDQTHILTTAGTWRIGRGWQVGGTFRLVSGNPETPVVGAVYNADRDVYRPVYGAVNSARNPLFHRLDLRIEKHWHPGPVLLAAYLDVQNVYNQQNREIGGYGFDYRQRVDVTGLPVFPSIGLRGEL